MELLFVLKRYDLFTLKQNWMENFGTFCIKEIVFFHERVRLCGQYSERCLSRAMKSQRKLRKGSKRGRPLNHCPT